MGIGASTTVERRIQPQGGGHAAQPDTAVRHAQGREERSRLVIPGRWHTALYWSAVLILILYGWQRRGDTYLSPEEGAGYALGIIGGSMMALLMLYPLRKHARWMRRFGKVKSWFRAHMLLGIAGPLCILYHCNFQLGSMNGNIALFSMLLVSSSGLLGRYLYTRIHYGLYGRKADLEHLGMDAVVIRNYMHRIFAVAPALQELLTALEKQTLRHPDSLIGGLCHVVYISVRSHWCAFLSGRHMRNAQEVIIRRDRLPADERDSLRASSRYYLRLYLETIRRVAGFTFYERLFALWHVMHMPLFVMLLITGILHVYAVHFY